MSLLDRLWPRFFFVCIFFVTAALPVFSQDEAKFTKVNAKKDGVVWEIEIDFDTEFDSKSFSSSVIRIIDAQVPRDLRLKSKQEENGFITITLADDENLNCKKPYVVFISNLVFPGKPKTKEIFKRLNVEDANNCPVSPNRVESNSLYKLQKVDSGSRDDADIYISGQLSGARKKKTQYTAEVKLEPNLKRTSGARIVKYGPSFELLASTVPDADPDSLKLGFYISFFPWTRSGYAGTRRAVPIKWKNTFALESNRNFTNTNYLWDTRFTYVAKTYKTGERCSGSACIYFRPFMGQELGVNLKSPVVEARRKLIYRPYFGASLSAAVPIKAGIKEMIFDVSYIRRFLLKKEVTFSEDNDENLIVERFGRSPKDLVRTTLQFNFNDFWGAKITHEYGSVPPLYKLLDNKFSVGLTFLGEVKPR